MTAVKAKWALIDSTCQRTIINWFVYWLFICLMISFQNRIRCYRTKSQNLWGFKYAAQQNNSFEETHHCGCHLVLIQWIQWIPPRSRPSFQMITNGGKTHWTVFFFSATQDGQEKTKLMKTESRSGGTRLFQAASQNPPTNSLQTEEPSKEAGSSGHPSQTHLHFKAHR